MDIHNGWHTNYIFQIEFKRMMLHFYNRPFATPLTYITLFLCHLPDQSDARLL